MVHAFRAELAAKYGLHEAIVFEHVAYSVLHNQANEENIIDGRAWMYNSRRAIAMLYPYFTERQVRTALDNLAKDGLIEKASFNRKAFDQTTWYTLTEKGQKTIAISDWTQKSNRVDKNAPIDVTRKSNRLDAQVQPIPIINKDDVVGENDCISYTYDVSTDRRENNDCRNEGTTEKNESMDDRGAFDLTIEELQRGVDKVVVYATNNLLPMTPNNLDELVSFREQLSDDLIIYAIDEACGNGVRKYAYVKSILNDLVSNSIKTVGEARALKSRWQNKRAGKDPDDVSTLFRGRSGESVSWDDLNGKE